MTKLIIIAGPQSSGKTTAFNLLREKFSSLTFIPEINQYIVKDRNHLGGVFVGKDLELKLIDEDIKAIENIDRTLPCVVIETGIFHLLYLEKICGKKMVKDYFKKYIEAHKEFHPIILFVDTKPHISWKRRKKTYLKRIQKAGVTDPKEKKAMLEKYKKRIFDLYPLWHKYYRLFPFEKYMIKNSYKSYAVFLEQLFQRAEKILNR